MLPARSFSKLPLLTALFLLLALLLPASVAGSSPGSVATTLPSIADYCYNWDLFPPSPPTLVNDLHMTLYGPTTLLDEFLTIWGKATQVTNPDGSLTLKYQGVAPLAPGQVFHMGFCTDRPIFWATQAGGLPPHYWTFDGVPVGTPLPMPGIGFQRTSNPNAFQVAFSNRAAVGPVVRVQNLQFAPLPGAGLPLQNLTWNTVNALGLQWDTARPPIDVQPMMPDSFFDVFMEAFSLRAATLTPPEFAIMRTEFADPANPSAPPIRMLSQVRLGAAPFQTYCYNWDFVNETGETVNDLHIWLDGPTLLADVYTGPLNPFGWPDPRAGYDPAKLRYHLFWSGVVVLPGAEVHVGFCSDRPLNSFRSPDGSGLPPIYWTKDGVVVPPPIAVPAIEWSWDVGGNLEIVLALADGMPAQMIGGLEIAPLPMPLPLPPITPRPPIDLDLLTYANLGTQPLTWTVLSTSGPLPPGGSLTLPLPPGLIDPNLPEQTFVIRYVANSASPGAAEASPISSTDIVQLAVAGEIVIQQPAAPDATASATPPETVNLEWPDTPNAQRYGVWRATAPYAVPGAAGTTPIGSGAPDGTGGWTLSDGDSNLGQVPVHTFYTVVAYNSAGQPSLRRNYEGEFEFALVPGTP